MAPRSKQTPDEIRDQIAKVAEDLFRRMGFTKTAVADIAAELGMSPANVYRFFPSKHAIVECICSRCLGEMEAEIRRVQQQDLPVRTRIHAVFQTILRNHLDNFIEERRVHEMVLVAIEHNWQNILAHRERIRTTTAQLLREGIADGSFALHDPEEVSAIFLDCCARFCHPVLVAQSAEEELDKGLQRTIDFLLKAIEPRD
ncbi:AcrR family transcriptional regulator [Rhodoligotrophos appendicifer]|uniref:TetR family transcriptional regulator n=1 Tax=Rhodoligotrophos appendicifer TaxID=987056 RepID=UPI001478758F|nr:TetR family transcriptional regulator [Rhodoligotrophos appendicifer]